MFGAALIVMLMLVGVDEVFVLSVAVTRKLNVPAGAVGTPVTEPLELTDSAFGAVPVHVYGGVPPLAERLWL